MDHIVWCRIWVIQENSPGKKPTFSSLHLKREDVERFIHAYWDSMPKDTPEQYAMPALQTDIEMPYLFQCKVSTAVYERIQKSGIGMWSADVPRDTTDAISMITVESLVLLEDGMKM